ncbi:RnfH family protein [Candidatus Vallotia tarda]|uniref:RnfH family protein n=1 Tax=Candidatus Vallotiella hemipterorum TaxID=1177213 RepID=UPI001C1F59E6|nr:RnfH family protein [Candidatus Vallotia tarda]
MLNIQVCYALPNVQTLVYLQLPVGTVLYDAILASKISSIHPQIHLAQQRVGVFGQARSLYSVLENGDRVEIYRPLIVDPKLARSLVVQKRRTKRVIFYRSL